METRDFVLKYFGKYAGGMRKIFPSIENWLKKSEIGMHIDTYYAMMLFILLVSIFSGAILVVVAILTRLLLLGVVGIFVPFVSLAILVLIPPMLALNRGSALDSEFPHVANYLSTIVMSGLSPFESFERIIRASHIFQHSAEIARRFVILNRMLGKDPLTAFAELSERTTSNKVKETLSGYIATVKSGGDVVDYLNKRARLLFQELLVGVKIIADRLAGLLESYLAITLLTLISFSVLYFVTAGFAGVVPFGLSDFQMFLFLYIIMPFLSFAIIYLTDVMQYKDPYMDWRPITFYMAVSLPIITVLSIVVFVVGSVPALASFPIISALKSFLLLGQPVIDYLQVSVMLSTILIIGSIPSIIYYMIISRDYKVISGITRFLRDLVEVRKTGLSPEKSIIELSWRDYGYFTPHLRKMALQLSLGIPLSVIFDNIEKNIKSWMGKALLYVLTDSIEVGGGTVEVLENLAWFAESVEAIENEKKRSLRTLLIVPYMGALLSSFTIIYMVAFMTSLPYQVGGFGRAAGLVLPSIVINSYIMGLVAGKVSSGRIAAGFLHATLLTLANLLLFLMAPLFVSGVSF